MWKIIKRYLLLWGCVFCGLCALSAVLNRRVLASNLRETFSGVFIVCVIGIVLLLLVGFLFRRRY